MRMTNILRPQKERRSVKESMADKLLHFLDEMSIYFLIAISKKLFSYTYLYSTMVKFQIKNIVFIFMSGAPPK